MLSLVNTGHVTDTSLPVRNNLYSHAKVCILGTTLMYNLTLTHSMYKKGVSCTHALVHPCTRALVHSCLCALMF